MASGSQCAHAVAQLSPEAEREKDQVLQIALLIQEADRTFCFLASHSSGFAALE